MGGNSSHAKRLSSAETFEIELLRSGRSSVENRRIRKEVLEFELLPSSGSQSLERWAVLPTEHFSHNEDEYCSAKAAAQEQI
jgi:hypothetical protein